MALFAGFFYKIFQGKLADSLENAYRYKVSEDSCSPKLILNLEYPFNKLTPETRNLLIKLEQFVPAIELICKCLPLYHLAMVSVELNADTPNWALAINAEMLKRHSIFNWQVCHGTSLKPNTSYPVLTSSQLFSTKINAAITFFTASNSTPTDIQYHIPKMGFKEATAYESYVMHDTSLFLKILNECISIQKLIHINAGKIEKCLFSTLYFPQIPNVEVKYFDSVEEFTYIIEPDEQVECILMFTMYYEPEYEIMNLLSELGKKQATNIPIAGATAYGMSFKGELLDDDTTFAMNYIAFTRKKNSPANFYAASIVVKQNQNFNSKVLEFRASLERHQQEFLLCFVCFAKQRISAEPLILAEHFDCPVFYMEVNGELGHNCYSKEHRETAKSKSKLKKSWIIDNYIHGFTTVMVYISWGKLRSI